MQVATLFNFLFVNIDKVTILYYYNVVSTIISLLFSFISCSGNKKDKVKDSYATGKHHSHFIPLPIKL